MSAAAVMLIALVLEALIGWPARLHVRIGHPVTWIGALIATLDRRLNRENRSAAVRRAAGLLAVSITVGTTVAVAGLLTALLPEGPLGTALAGLLAWPLIATRSLHSHVGAVLRPLLTGDLPAARQAVAMIVGRDPQRLDREGIARATLESLAENSSDGIVAPIFWGLLLGLPGVAAYKAINTLDSMIGHRTERHGAFGWAAARLDDLANLIPARATGLLFALVSTRPRSALLCMLRDARRHRSPNAGWPEAAMAGALEVRLSGPRSYGTRLSSEPWLNGGAADPAPGDLARGLALFRRAIGALAFLLAIAVLV
ncbi:adenosylcobinamide-phosphate synthase CbiB [Algihabitans albus]|uniref:adenosylcobinamide-phosphate synthase CbiB n=1 Tax=Algihabitans albus TaxID=2164067 RepID=UPI000E5D82B7|nr:adenosylcobinamide-phosphate synthase CbiB [Algihabitans albus]